jgi:hypothetical protein
VRECRLLGDRRAPVLSPVNSVRPGHAPPDHVPCWQDEPRLCMGFVERHYTVGKIAGYRFRHGIPARDKIFYTTALLSPK